MSWPPIKLRKFLARHKAKPTDLAAALGVTRAAVSYWLNGKRVPSPLACKALDQLRKEWEGK